VLIGVALFVACALVCVLSCCYTSTPEGHVAVPACEDYVIEKYVVGPSGEKRLLQRERGDCKEEPTLANAAVPLRSAAELRRVLKTPPLSRHA